MEKSHSPTYLEGPPDFTPTQTYQPGQPPHHQDSPPPSPMYPPMLQPSQQTITLPNRVANGSSPTRKCPSCHAEIKQTANSSTNCCGCCSQFLCFLCFPYFMDPCKCHNDYCPNCNAYIGT